MSARIELHSYVGRIERRLRLGALSRGAALVAAVALVATVLLVLVASAFAFSDGSITGSRLALFSILALAMLFGLGLPLWRVNRRRAVGQVEALFPAFQQRLVTFTERDKHDEQDRAADPFVELLAAETLDVAAGAQPSAVAPTAMLLASLAIGVVSLGLLVWMIVARPGVIGYGANLLWTGSQDSAAPLYDLRVQPGNATLRRNTDQVITAQPVGILSPRVLLYARYHSAAKWEQVEMRPRSGASGYQFVFTGVPEDVEYYVEAGPRQSKHFTIRVVDPPSVKQIKVTLHYPSWTGLKDTVDEHGGDLRALEGTRADLDVVTDKPLTDGLLALDDGQKIQLAAGTPGSDAGSHHYHGTIEMERDGLYHVATLDQGQQVRLSEDFFIEARKAMAPTVAIARPGNDYRASPIEEVTLGVHAQDDYGLQNLDLHYSVNGGPDRVVHLLKQPGDKQASGSSVLPLEDLKLVPGDVISVYAEAKNANLETRTDMSFIQVDPFEREFSQSQQAGGGGGGGSGGGGDQPGEISRREKEMIASTFRQLGGKRNAGGKPDGGKTDSEKQAAKQAADKEAAAKQAAMKQAAEAGKFLSEAQSALRDQALSLAGRLAARDLTTENQEFSAFQQEMRAAADAMDPATQKLQQQKWQEAIPDEQKALQHLLRAEATFRQIEVAFGARGGGGGGGGAGRDLASLFDLELDMEKNQYETQQSASTADQRARDINDALKKLDELARRQEDLAQQRNNSSQSFQQRWQQEMLQREAQELQRQVEQLTRQAQNRQADGQQQGQQSASARGQAGQSGQAGESDQSGQSGQGQGGQAGQSARAGQRGQFGQSGQAGQSDDATESGRAGQGGQRGQSARAGQRGQFGQAGESGEAGAAGRGAAEARARATQQAAEQALDRLRQAQDDMRRAAADPQRAAEARRAADRLREASNLLSGLQSQEATSRLGSITREADRLVNEQRDQSDRVKRVKDRANASSGDAQTAQSTERDVQQLATDRQRLADDLTALEQNMRNAARELDAGQRAASDKLRSALEGADQSDLETHLQRTADWLRTGIDPTGNGTESQIATDLQHLRDQVHQAQQALTAGGQGQQTDQTEAALNSIDRLRSQLESLRRQTQGQGQNPGQNSGQGADRGDPSRAGQQQQPGQMPAGQGYQTESLSRNGGQGQDGSANAQDPRSQAPGSQRGARQGQQGQGSQGRGSQGQGSQQASAGSPGSPGSQGAAGAAGSPGAQGAAGGQGANNGGGQGSQSAQGGPGGAGGQRGPGADGPIGQLAPGGGYRDGTVWDNVDVGNNARSSGRAAAGQSTPAIDRQQLIQQGVTELNRLRQQAAGDPEMQRQIQSLITAMEHLDLRRFPGNPAAIDELNQRLLAGIDTLELRLRRDLDDKHPGQIRGTDPASIPAGYEDAVAEYYRRLSGTPAGNPAATSTNTSTPASRRGSSQ